MSWEHFTLQVPYPGTSNPDSDILEMKLHYDIDYEGDHNNRGYWVSVVPVKITKLDGGFALRESGAFTGFKEFIIESPRRNETKRAKAIEHIKSSLQRYLDYFVQRDELKRKKELNAEIDPVGQLPIVEELKKSGSL